MLTKLEILAEQSKPVINMSYAACDDILRSGKYRNYHQRIETDERRPANEQNHSARTKVGVTLFSFYEKHILYAVLSPDGRGLTSYDKVAMRWEVTSAYLRQRLSLLEENSFTFYDHHELGDLDARIPAGFRAIWEDRTKLVAAKLAHRLTTATAENGLSDLLMHPGATRKDDEFVEAFVYEDRGMDTRDVDLVTFQSAPTTDEERHRAELVRGACAARNPAIRLIE